jgi:hypothetical protein
VVGVAQNAAATKVEKRAVRPAWQAGTAGRATFALSAPGVGLGVAAAGVLCVVSGIVEDQLQG